MGVLLASAAVVAAPSMASAVGRASASGGGPVRLTASIDGASLQRATEPHPLQVRPGQEITVEFQLRNSGRTVLSVRSVNLEGHIAGLTFYSFDTEVSFDVPSGGTKSLTYQLDTTSLRGQVTGLVPSSLVLLGPNGGTIASEPFVARMNGSLWSVYGLFGLGILVLTVLALVEVIRALAAGRLPTNRWHRGMRFLAAGIGVGGIAVFSASAAAKWLPSNGHWLVILGVGAVAGFVIGYLTPTPLSGDEGDVEDEEDEEIEGAAGQPAGVNGLTA
jgi:hypothetical protein